MKNKYLTIINSLDDISKLKNIGINKFLYPLKFFSVGFNNYFDITDITIDNAYLYINRLLSSSEIDDLRSILNNLPNNIKGIVFDDLGILQIVKDISLEKILILNHVSANSVSVNEYLQYVDSIILSTDITIDEVNYILKKSKKELCIFGYGYQNISYSRRLLNTNYSKYHKLNNDNILLLKNTDYEFLSVESEFGTYFYENKIYNGLNEVYQDSIKYIIINLFNIGADEFINNQNSSSYKGFLDKKTIYKLKGGE